MTALGGSSHAENPFSTRHIRPGALPFLFPAGQDAKGLVESLRARGWQGAIVGPHGSGKSSLVAAMIPAVQDAGRKTILIELHDGQRRLPVDLRRIDAPADRTLVIVDGYEQLSRVNRWRLRWFCRGRGIGLLVTSHEATALPLLFRTSTNPILAQEIVQRLLGGPSDLVEAGELAQRLERHRGNLRDLFFELYDLYEQRRA